MALACTHTTAPTGQGAAVTAASRSFRARPPWPTHSAAGQVVAIGRADVSVARKPDDIVETQVAEEVRTV